MTVAQLIERLAAFDPDAVVMIECEDNYYDGPLSEEIKTAQAGLAGPCEYQTPGEDAYGNYQPPRTRHYAGGDWVIIDEEMPKTSAPMIERRPCIVLRT